MQKSEINKKEKGFTLIEVMISTALFSVIMIIGITAVLSVNNTYRKTRTMRSAIDNVSFMMEDMARNIRLGYLYRCINSTANDPEIEEPLNTPPGDYSCRGIAFEPYWNPVPGDIGDQVIYYIGDDGDIFKSTNGIVLDGAPMNSIDVKIDPLKSGFTIVGSESNTDAVQPMVLIRINGTAQGSRSSTNFNLQTTVSQRLIDAP